MRGSILLFMKHILIFIFFFLSFELYSQKIVKDFLNEDFASISSKDSAKYYRVYFINNSNQRIGSEKTFRIDGSIYSEGVYSDDKKLGTFSFYYSSGAKWKEESYESGIHYATNIWATNGQLIEESEIYDRKNRVVNSWDSLGNPQVVKGTGRYFGYSENFQLLETGEFSNFEKTGVWNGYFNDGKTYYIEKYISGELSEGKSYNKQGQEFEYNVLSVSTSNYQIFYELVGKNLRYPVEARRKGVQGKVYVKFTIGENGKAISSSIYKGIGSGCDQEVLRVINSSSLQRIFGPTIHRGQPIKQTIILPITFKLG